MFVLKQQLPQWIGKQVKIVGKLVKIETPDLIISTHDGDVRVVYRELHKYTDRIVIVTGTVTESLKVEEEYVDEAPNGFCMETYAGMAKLGSVFEEIFTC